eukprot:TRINITY_DN70047_c0_g1_i1.p1 TRINITY_DN70047_c0_g1~~TRINITY_DN70047_c0_g1_i1.p1  ORF type:complete len:233 (+),score=24.90 TRINITY_DN70047_c0_g1_i1:110-808(+)
MAAADNSAVKKAASRGRETWLVGDHATGLDKNTRRVHEFCDFPRSTARPSGDGSHPPRRRPCDGGVAGSSLHEPFTASSGGDTVSIHLAELRFKANLRSDVPRLISDRDRWHDRNPPSADVAIRQHCAGVPTYGIMPPRPRPGETEPCSFVSGYAVTPNTGLSGASPMPTPRSVQKTPFSSRSAGSGASAATVAARMIATPRRPPPQSSGGESDSGNCSRRRELRAMLEAVC